jgi:peroxiredoxin
MTGLKATLKKILPFLIVLIAVIVLAQYQKSRPMPGPQVTLIAPEMRSAQGTEFTLPDLAGKPMRIDDFKGNVVLLNFFATWCGPCREEMPTIQELFQAYQSKGLVVVAVSSDAQGAEIVTPFVKEHRLTFPVLVNPDSSVLRQYNVRGIPTVYLLDRKGRIAGLFVGGADWNSKPARDLIDQLLRES